MKRKKLFTWVVTVLCAGSLTFSGLTNAQSPKRAYTWYFGDQAGLDFSQGHPVAVTDGAMSAFEGSAVISDEAGNLMFYTNGGDLPYNGGIWNRNHQLMPNGDLSGAGGCSSSFQSSLILPHPRHQQLYYLFTTDCIENGSNGGLRYSIVDMTLDGGLGDVVVKGEPLISPVDESLTAVRHKNGEDYWIIAHKLHTDSFYVYHLNATGITGVIKTRIGAVTPDYAGTLVASTNGQKLVYSGLNFTSLFDFDTETGIISNYLDLGTPSYSAMFSPNCELLYVADGLGKTLYQYDMMVQNIPASQVTVGTTLSTGFGGMQLGPDGRIYAARFVTSDYLGMIKFPNYRGTACDYIDNGVYLDGRFGKGGLPNFPNDWVGECLLYPVENVSNYDFQHLRESDIDSDGFNVEWENNNDQNILGYRVFVREVSSDNWTEHFTEKNHYGFEGLNSSTSYEVRVLPEVQHHEAYQRMDNHFTSDLLSAAGKNDPSSDQQLTVSTGNVFDFDVYPNPAQASSTVTVNLGDGKSNIDIILMESSGRILEEFNFDQIQGKESFTLDTKNLPNGIYHVAVQTDQTYEIKKLIVMK